MSVAEILCRARELGVRLRVEGDRVKMKGPPEALAELKPEIAAEKEEVMSFLRAMGSAR
ncbi:hypothetical protein [Paraburkholderia sp. 35.1]|uniref:TubC N-terminal docking domain-related protein n=1 Tax=Paraburkholderia sp. 35.1 TaxID=2991058 RepID=UPI003D1EF356